MRLVVGGFAMAGAVVIGAAIAIPPVAAQEARFTVTPKVINPDLQPFTATATEIGNGSDLTRTGGGFEPAVFRNMIIAEADAPNSIIADRSTLSGYDSWPDGTFDGADIEVLRIVDGRFVTVRRDKIADGGFHASGWLPLLPGGQVLPARQTTFTGSWDGYNRLGAPWYYTVRAIDGQGNLSPEAPAIAVTAPAKPGKVEGKPDLEKRDLSGRNTDRLAAPANLTGRVGLSQTLLLNWDPVPGAAGYVLYRSDLPPEAHRGYGMALAGDGAAIRKGDMVLLRKKFYAPPRAEVATNRVWGTFSTQRAFGVPLVSVFPGDPGVPDFRLVPHEAATPVQDPGETYLQVDLRQGQKFNIGLYNHSGTEQIYYPVLDPAKTYRFEVWLRAKGSAGASFDVVKLYGRQIQGLPGAVQIGPEWRKYSIDFQVPRLMDGRSPGQMLLTLSGNGQVDVDNFRIYRADAPFMDLLPEDREAFESSGMAALRMHSLVRTGSRSYDLAQLTNPAGGTALAGGTSLPQLLGLTASLDVSPWLQIEPHLAPEEWLGLAEYLAAPFDPAKDDPKALPWAAKRVAQGHAAPWVDDFSRIYFEIGNETWNPIFRPWTFPPMRDGGRTARDYTAGEVYGLYQEHVLAILRESPWWDRIAPKLDPVLGGWIVRNFGVDALSMSPGTHFLTNAAYIGGWDVGEGPVKPTTDGYTSVMVYAPQAMAPDTIRPRDAVRAEMPDRKVSMGTYESGPGYAKNGLNRSKVTPEQKADQELVMKSAAAGAATLDSFLTRAREGDRIQNFFGFERGDEWSSHAVWFRGGNAHPSWSWLSLFNRIGTGDMLEVDTRRAPTVDMPAMERRKAMDDVPLVAAYATRKNDRLTVVVISRAVPAAGAADGAGAIPVSLDLPISGATKLTRYRQSGNYRAENIFGLQTQIISEDLAVPADPARLEIPALPPASAEVYVFEGITPAG